MENKFNVGDVVTTIHNDTLRYMFVQEVNIVITKRYTRVQYVLLDYKAVNFGDADRVTVKDQSDCFSSFAELVNAKTPK